MSDLLKAELPGLLERDADGYWIKKANSVDGSEVSTVQHFRLFRKNRVRFDPRPHGGATAVSENVERFDPHRHRSREDGRRADLRRRPLRADGPGGRCAHVRKAQLALPQSHAARGSTAQAPVGSRTPGAGRRRPRTHLGRRPDRAARAARSCAWTAPIRAAIARDEATTWPDGDAFDAAILAPAGDDPLATVRIVAGLVRPGGVIIGTARAARNRRRIEEFVAGVLSDGTHPDGRLTGSSTRRELLDELLAADLDVRWMTSRPRRLARPGGAASGRRAARSSNRRTSC